MKNSEMFFLNTLLKKYIQSKDKVLLIQRTYLLRQSKNCFKVQNSMKTNKKGFYYINSKRNIYTKSSIAKSSLGFYSFYKRKVGLSNLSSIIK